VLYYKSFDNTDLAISCLLLFASARSPFDQQSFTVEDSSIEGDADSIDDPDYSLRRRDNYSYRFELNSIRPVALGYTVAHLSRRRTTTGQGTTLTH
jgi:hypothetical protein